MCDVHDALISERCKVAWTREQSAAETGRQSGRHLDPAGVRAFLNVMNEQSEQSSLRAGIADVVISNVPGP